MCAYSVLEVAFIPVDIDTKIHVALLMAQLL